MWLIKYYINFQAKKVGLSEKSSDKVLKKILSKLKAKDKYKQ